LLALVVLLPAIGRAQAEQSNRAGLVIRHGDGRVTTACVSFTEPEISGIDLLERAGVSYLGLKSSIGAAVCKLDGEGCDYPAEDCFCHCKGIDCIYWVYHHLRDGKWSYSQLSPSRSKLQPGDVDGWAWGSGNNQAGAQLPLLSFQEVCAAPANAPSAPTEPQPPTLAAASPLPPTEAAPASAEIAPTSDRRPTAAAPQKRAPKTTAVPPTQEPQATLALPTNSPPTQEPRASATARQSEGHTPTTSQPATASVFPTKNPSATVGTAGGVVATRTPAQPGGGVAATGYLAFGALALLLVGAIVGVLLRRRG
jgi:hypothetical protein